MDGYSNYEWFLKTDFSDYAGRWIAIVDKQVVSSGNDVTKVIKEAKKAHPKSEPFITKIRTNLSIL